MRSAKGRTERQRRHQENVDARRDAGIERLRALADQVLIDTRLFRAAVRQGLGYRTVLQRAEDALATLRHARARTLVLLGDSEAVGVRDISSQKRTVPT